MGLFSFMKDAGEKLFGKGEAHAAPSAAPAPAGTAREAGNEAANLTAGKAIADYIKALGIAPADLVVTYDATASTVTVSGTAPDQATREKILLAAGNVAGVAEVENRLSVSRAEPEAQFHTVARGDTLSAIAKQFYGKANAWNRIFEANRDQLDDPDRIQPGQVLRIPAAVREDGGTTTSPHGDPL